MTGMRTALLSTTALALFTVLAAPVAAETWVTYRTQTDWYGDGKHRTYQIDVASIAKHNGWIHSNHRICLEYMTDCRAVRSVSAHCKDGKLKEYSPVINTRRNGNEWWADFEIRDGTRYKYVSKEDLKFTKEMYKRVDAGKT